MKPMSNRKPYAASSLSVTALILGVTLSAGLPATPAYSDGFLLRKGAAAGQNGVVARSRGVVSNGEGSGLFRRNGFAADGQGNGFAGFGNCANGQTGSGCRGGSVSWNSDGAFSRNLGAELSGENRAFSSRRSLDRDADGNLNGSRSTDASGTNGAYAGNSTLDRGTYNRDGTYTGSDGQTATVEGAYERGTGGSRSVTCIDATGAVVSCP